MKTLLAVLAVFCLAEAAPSPSVGFLEDMAGTRIMNGQEAAVGQFPHQLSLMLNSGNYHNCGAVLVAADTALTAAHCVVPINPGNYRVRAGQHTQGSPVSEHDVSSIDQHEDYNQGAGSYPNDIAVLHLASSADVSDSLIDDIRICRGADGDHAGSTCQISGWGTTESGPSPSQLNYADTTVIDNADCQARMVGVIGATVIDSHICVYNGQHGACSGDSGGPMTCGDCLAGVTSWGIMSGGVCSVAHPSVYTRISSFEAWIDGKVPGLP